MKTYIDLTNTVKKYKGKWVVFDANLKNIVTFATTAKKAYDKAIKKGFEKPTLFKVPQKNIPYFGICIHDKVQI
ncbi:hypothetical protein A2954_07330 [Candidatus Roizmanbacteria bacterium RIFCSPLOWO2_01_FULL_37_12]|uniref:DUF5678 domain-containing protein n=1 Tax=Candidatus Roizmanbacteria bacterium RIFCSPLOWO2_01_FULL_37_12 TaxID=1802056 RepID=A0A1F7IE86_9BACT|nr:MAG: hypothetical protein A2954_07330 [Candidatus Roizmanbacteria bacterium RIFCSPLOWO2_01_FULL_37_12]